MFHEYKAKLNRVVDGDTMDLEIDLGFRIKIDIRVRLLGVNTFELRDKDESIRNKALLEKVYATNILAEHETLIVKTSKTGKYGRWLAEIFLTDGRSFNTLMATYHQTIKNYAT